MSGSPEVTQVCQRIFAVNIYAALRNLHAFQNSMPRLSIIGKLKIYQGNAIIFYLKERFRAELSMSPSKSSSRSIQNLIKFIKHFNMALFAAWLLKTGYLREGFLLVVSEKT